MNKMWHQNNRMPAKPSLAQRIEWHKEHQKHCSCRDIPQSLKKYITRKTTRKP